MIATPVVRDDGVKSLARREPQPATFHYPDFRGLRSFRRKSLEALLFCNQRLFWTRLSEGGKRGVDLLLGSGLLLVLGPAILGSLGAARLRGGGLRRSEYVGRGGKVFGKYWFHFGPAEAGSGWCRRALRELPVLLNIVAGDMSFVGPRPFAPNEVGAGDRFAWRRFDVKPGLICLWWLRRRANIAYRSETEHDAEYVDGQSARRDLGILLRSLAAGFYGENHAPAAEKIDFFGIPIDNVTIQEAAGRIIRQSYEATPSQVCFVNADCVNIAFRDVGYKAILRQASLVLADGIGMKLAGRILNRPICQNVNGTDLLPVLCQQLAGQNRRLYLLGGRRGVAGEVAGWIKRNYPGVVVSGFADGYYAAGDIGRVLAGIRESEADILLVALGAPRQEQWIAEHLTESGCAVAMGVGGLFDFYAQRVPRAPIWIREIGMEWFFRFLQEPRRMWKRYIAGNLLFLARVFLARG